MLNINQNFKTYKQMKKIQELLAAQRELAVKMANAEGENLAALEREYNANKREIELLNQEAAAAKNAPAAREKSANELLREGMAAVMNHQQREVELDKIVDFGKVNTNGGLVETKIHSIIDTINEGLDLPVGCEIVGGVEGNDLWPVSVSDVDLQEVGENAELSDAEFDFDKITPLVKRAGVPVPVSNKAIDNAAFDLLGFTAKKINTAKRRYLASRIYSQAAWGTNNVKGPFSGLASSGTITIGSTAYKAILKAVAEFTNKGLDGKPCLVIDAVTEAELKATPKAEGQGGFIIENGKCAGYDYVVSHFINTKMNAAGTALENTTDKYLGIGYFNYLAVQQHGAERLGLDASSKAVMIKNQVCFVYNTEFSITDLSVKLNAKGGTTTQAFALYKLA